MAETWAKQFSVRRTASGNAITFVIIGWEKSPGLDSIKMSPARKALALTPARSADASCEPSEDAALNGAALRLNLPQAMAAGAVSRISFLWRGS
jgi:hypothetical protein